ncbi:hypothetical protein ES702_04584 [subsurface metagenome]
MDVRNENNINPSPHRDNQAEMNKCTLSVVPDRESEIDSEISFDATASASASAQSRWTYVPTRVVNLW